MEEGIGPKNLLLLSKASVRALLSSGNGPVKLLWSISRRISGRHKRYHDRMVETSYIVE